MTRSIDDQLIKYLTDVHSIEEQALPQLRAATEIAGEPSLEEVFRVHLRETEEQERQVRARLEANDASPSKLKDLVGKGSSFAFVLFAKSQPDTPGKLVNHAYSYEHLELAAYDLLVRVAEQAGDLETAAVARRIREEEAAMARRLEERFDAAVDASLRDLSPDDLGEQLNKYLADAHAIEKQSLELLERGPKIAGDAQLEQVIVAHRGETREHVAAIEKRLEARGSSPSKLKDAAMRLGALNWGAFFAAQPDTPAKLAGFAFAVEHLEAAAYEQLKRVAARAGDEETTATAEKILSQEHDAARRIRGTFDSAVEASLEKVGAAA